MFVIMVCYGNFPQKDCVFGATETVFTALGVFFLIVALRTVRWCDSSLVWQQHTYNGTLAWSRTRCALTENAGLDNDGRSVCKAVVPC